MRALYGESNSIDLSVSDVTQPKNSDQLFKGIFASKCLIDRVLLEIEIVDDGGGTVTDASLGDLTIMSTREGNIQTLPLRFLYKALPNMGVTCKEEAITNGKRYHIPIPFGLLKGTRPKDTYLVSEKCNDFFFEIRGADEGLTYVTYKIRPLIIAEKSLNAVLPSKGYLRYVTDDIPASVWYDSHIRVKAPTFVVFALSDYADFVHTDEVRLTVDSEVKAQLSDIIRFNRIYASVHMSHHLEGVVTDTIPDDVIIVPLTLDKKMAKISRSSEYQFAFKFASAKTVRCLYQVVEPMTGEEARDIAKRQGVVVNDKYIKLVPVDETGRLNPNAKQYFRKIYKQYGKQIRRVSNSA